MNNKAKKLYRIRENKFLAGVCTGLGDYFTIDPVIIRIIFILLTLVGGGGLLIYIILALVVPMKTAENPSNTQNNDNKYTDIEETDFEIVDDEKKKSKNRTSLGIIAILVGFFILLGNFIRYHDFVYIWPTLLVLGGIALLISGGNLFSRKDKNEENDNIADVDDLYEEDQKNK
ncbi:MAG: PspC domain-containing protein [Bacteroidales bacterium]|jgi:phage shock protein C